MDPLMTTMIILAFPIGVLVGLGAGVIGLTAWPLLVPLLLVFGGVPLHEALLSSLLVDLAIAFVLSAFYVRHQEVAIDSTYGVKLGIVAGIVALVTASLAFPILEQFSSLFEGGSSIITLLFGIMFIVQAFKMKNFTGTKREGSKSGSPHLSGKQKESIVYGFCILQGFLTGLIAMGGAMNIALVLMFIVGLPTLRAVGTAMVATTIMLSMTVISYLVLLQFSLSTVLLVSLYVVIGSISSYLAVTRIQSISERKLRFTIGIVILIAAIFATTQVYLLR
ncbi:MAG: sulfite exporter TauE/SafE family protein [Candidatus Thorarchaeota archaeon]|nr:sulfite exporter TauE/SafE family protein [Candidatus Thorarchaeota archaeon]